MPWRAVWECAARVVGDGLASIKFQDCVGGQLHEEVSFFLERNRKRSHKNIIKKLSHLVECSWRAFGKVTRCSTAPRQR